MDLDQIRTNAQALLASGVSVEALIEYGKELGLPDWAISYALAPPSSGGAAATDTSPPVNQQAEAERIAAEQAAEAAYYEEERRRLEAEEAARRAQNAAIEEDERQAEIRRLQETQTTYYQPVQEQEPTYYSPEPTYYYASNGAAFTSPVERDGYENNLQAIYAAQESAARAAQETAARAAQEEAAAKAAQEAAARLAAQEAAAKAAAEEAAKRAAEESAANAISNNIRTQIQAAGNDAVALQQVAKTYGLTPEDIAGYKGTTPEAIQNLFLSAGVPLGTLLTGDISRTTGTEQGIRQIGKGEDVVAEQIIGTQGDKYVVQAYDAYGQPMGTRLAEPNPSEAQEWLQVLAIVGAALGAGAGLESLLGSGASELAAADIALGGAGGSSGAAGLSSGLTVGEAVGVISNPTSLITNPISKGLSDYVISNLGLTGAEALAAKTAVYATVNGTAAELMGGNFKDAATGTIVAAGLQHLPLPTGDLGLTNTNLTFNQITGRIADSVIDNVGAALGITDFTDTKAGEMLTSGAIKAVSGGLTAAAMGANSDQILTNMGIQGLVGALGDVKIPFTKLDDKLATELTTGSFAESIDLGDFNALGADASVTVGATALGNLDASLAGISNNLPVITQKGTATVTVTAADCAKQGKQYDFANGKCIEPSSGIAQILSGITGGIGSLPDVATPVTVQSEIDKCKAIGKVYNPSTKECDTVTTPVNVISSGIEGAIGSVPPVATPVPTVTPPVVTEKPTTPCAIEGQVRDAAGNCGCPEGQSVQDGKCKPTLQVKTTCASIGKVSEVDAMGNTKCVCPPGMEEQADGSCKAAEPPPKPDTPCGVTGQVRDAAGNCGCPAGQVVLNDAVSGTQYCGKPVAKPITPTCGADQYLDDYNNCTCVDPKKVIDSTTGLCIDTVAGGDGNDTIPTIPFLPNIPSGNTDPGYSPNLKQPWTASRTYTAPPKDYDYFEDPYFQRFGPITYTPPAGYEGAGKGGSGGYSPKLAEGGLAELAMAQGGRTLQPRYLGGITDGMADKVPANIDGRRPAALSDGEFVIPADVVSHLGNGNSSAGAKILYKMMDRIRKARTGTTKQGRQINPDKFLPR